MIGSEAIHGVIVPMITPITETIDIDKAGVTNIVEHLILGGVHGIFVLGTNGESASVDAKNKLKLVRATIEAVKQRVDVYAGISGNCLQESINNALIYADIGVSAVVAHQPQYFPIDNTAMTQWFTAIAEKSPVPLLLYNIPVITGHSIELGVVRELADHPNIIGIKDSDRDFDRLKSFLETDFGKPFPVLAGSNPNFARGLIHGAAGIVPGLGNIEPKVHVELYEAVVEKNDEQIEKLTAEISALCSRYLCGSSLSENIANVKAAAFKKGLCKPYVFPPMHTVGKGGAQ